MLWAHVCVKSSESLYQYICSSHRGAPKNALYSEYQVLRFQSPPCQQHKKPFQYIYREISHIVLYILRSRLGSNCLYAWHCCLLIMSFLPSTVKQPSIAPNDCNIPSPGTDGISSLNWSPAANYLVSSNWDGGVRCWEVQEQGGQIRAMPKAQGMSLQEMA
jgi:hypothetical protein